MKDETYNGSIVPDTPVVDLPENSMKQETEEFKDVSKESPNQTNDNNTQDQPKSKSLPLKNSKKLSKVISFSKQIKIPAKISVPTNKKVSSTRDRTNILLSVRTISKPIIPLLFPRWTNYITH
eukprot:TRINITY_DN235_c0_g1_i1.p1 TRINITY_DN235_c0_g1~~TRINITY_DN235_c0_g1_i1.p1  ORF type:complete len:123 (+),score=15.80 TRINITY_DN235_c0_g1_i1:417-785(+)